MNLQNQVDYLQELYGHDIFDGCTRETIPKPLEPTTVKSAIMGRCALLEPAYTEPKIMHQLITLWFKTNTWNFQHLVNIILAEYSPIENTDRYSEHKKSSDGSGSRSVTQNSKTTHDLVRDLFKDNEDVHSGTDRRDIERSGTDTTETQVSAYNATTYQPDHKELLTHGEITNDDFTHGHIVTTEGHDRTEETGSSSDTGTTQTTDKNTGSESYTEHTHGNIGVTTNQDLITQELELLQNFNAYDWIAKKFERDLCLQIY